MSIKLVKPRRFNSLSLLAGVRLWDLQTPLEYYYSGTGIKTLALCCDFERILRKWGNNLLRNIFVKAADLINRYAEETMPGILSR